MSENPMRGIRVEKVTVNMGVGQTGDELQRARAILERVTGAKTTATASRVKIPTWGIREGLTIGTKVTLRGKSADAFLRRAFKARDNKLRRKSFDVQGNFGFGVKEYIDLPETKYDPKLGIRGMDVLVTLERPGYRIKRRKLDKKKVPRKHLIGREDAVAFVSQKFGVDVV